MIHMTACFISLSVNTNRIQNSVVMQKRDPIQNFDMHLLLSFMVFEKLQSSKSVIISTCHSISLLTNIFDVILKAVQ